MASRDSVRKEISDSSFLLGTSMELHRAFHMQTGSMNFQERNVAPGISPIGFCFVLFLLYAHYCRYVFKTFVNIHSENNIRN